MGNSNYLHLGITELIIKAFYNVYNILGYGFLEKVYENSLVIELNKIGIDCKAQSPITVYYKSNIVGRYYSDIIVEDCVIIEIKTVKELIEKHEVQLLNYLKATDIEVGLLLNFGKEPQVRRKIFSNEFKH